MMKLSTLRKVFSLLQPIERWLVLFLAMLICSTLYWNWHIFYTARTTLIPHDGGSITEGIIGRPEFINPLLASSPTDEALVHAIFSGLYRYNATGTVVPDLAARMPEISPDEKQYTVTLLPNVQWHDGTPLTARDIVFTIEQIKNEAVGSPHRDAWLSTTAEEISPTTVRFSTKDVSGPFLHNLTIPILPQHIWSTITPTQYSQTVYNTKPIGSGPFTFVQYKKDPTGKLSTLTLKAFPSHPRSPHIHTLTFSFYDTAQQLEQAYVNGDINLTGTHTSDVSSHIQENATTQTTVRIAQYQAAFFNQTTPALQELSVRKALRIAVDSNELTQSAWGNAYHALSETPLGLVTSETTTTTADLERANQILETAGWKRTASGVRTKSGHILSVQLYTSNSTAFRATAELLAHQWKQLGVTTEVYTMPTSQLISEHVRPRIYDVLLFSQRSNADPDAFAFWHSSQSKDPGLNVSNFRSTEADQLIIQARTTTNANERVSLYNRLRGLLDTQVPALYINQSQYGYFSQGAISLPELTALPDPSWRTAFLTEAYARTTRSWK
ncbi:MAG: peptide ABC transporter substrate-binding protein [Candidatus Doudnabacteria bacterium]|nr:peptide ABC transporter substrate-binding protein [Candidatus Doudnabacteria bacterium]